MDIDAHGGTVIDDRQKMKTRGSHGGPAGFSKISASLSENAPKSRAAYLRQHVFQQHRKRIKSSELIISHISAIVSLLPGKHSRFLKAFRRL